MLQWLSSWSAVPGAPHIQSAASSPLPALEQVVAALMDDPIIPATACSTMEQETCPFPLCAALLAADRANAECGEQEEIGDV